jgi:hypothetical protein
VRRASLRGAADRPPAAATVGLVSDQLFFVGAFRGGLVRTGDLIEQIGQALHLFDALGLCHRAQKRDEPQSFRME